MFDKSHNFHIHQSILIDTPSATFNYGHGAQSSASDDDYHQIIV